MKNGMSYFKETLVKAAPGFGRWLRRQRLAAKLNQRELAESVGVTHQHVAGIEAGTANPSKALKKRLKGVLRNRLLEDMPVPMREATTESITKAASAPQDMIPADAVLNALAILEAVNDETKGALRLLLGKVSG